MKPIRSAIAQQGFSLMEVLIALFIISIGLLGVAGLQSTLIKDGFDTSQRSQMVWLTQEMISRMRANQPGQVSGYLNAAADGNLCTNGPAKMCSDYYSKGSASKVNGASDCSADQVAEFDVWELTCGYQNAGANSNAMDNILITGVDITCTNMSGGVCQPDLSSYTVTFNWVSKSAQDQINAGNIVDSNGTLENQSVSTTVKL